MEKPLNAFEILEDLVITLCISGVLLLGWYNPLNPVRVAERTVRWVADKIAEPAPKLTVLKVDRLSDVTEGTNTFTGGSAWVIQGEPISQSPPLNGDSLCYVSTTTGGEWAPCGRTYEGSPSKTIKLNRSVGLSGTLSVARGGTGTITTSRISTITAGSTSTQGWDKPAADYR